MSIAGLVMGAATLGTVSGAAGMSLDEFYRLDTIAKENFMTTVLHHFHKLYSQDPRTTYKAECMVALYEPPVAGDEPRLLRLIDRDMSRARDHAGKSTVERVVETVVERECAAP